jgi:hypothetical protein
MMGWAELRDSAPPLPPGRSVREVRSICRHRAGVNNGGSIFNLTLPGQYSAATAGAGGFGGTLVTDSSSASSVSQTPLVAHH